MNKYFSNNITTQTQNKTVPARGWRQFTAYGKDTTIFCLITLEN